jgi:putative transposase
MSVRGFAMANPYVPFEAIVEKHHRQSIRIKDFDYTSNMAYFVTICTWQREMTLGSVVSNEMQNNDIGNIIQNLWLEIPTHHPHVETDAFVTMPNHIHGILTFVRRGLPWQTLEQDRTPSFGHRVPGSLGSIIGQFKSAVTKQARAFTANPELQVWQRNYFEHIIRNERELSTIREYITFNPQNWSHDLEAKSDLELADVSFLNLEVIA